jgi:thiamine biosynthesis lipoprotein
MHRRAFLDPRRIAGAAAQVAETARQVRDLVAAEGVEEQIACLRFARRAMATNFEVLFPLGTPAGFEAADDALDEIDRLEGQLTVYRDDSEVSRINQAAAEQAVEVEHRLFELLLLCASLSADTDGAFDVSVGALVKAWGFYRRAGRVPPPEELAAVRNRVGMRRVVLEPASRSVRFRDPGVEFNFGSIGKGYALDRAAERLRSEWGVTAGLLHGGHSSVLALGSQPGHQRGWPVAVRHPWDTRRVLARLWLRDQALATSAATFQHLEYNGKKLGHLLDPRIGWPAEGMASASVIAPTAALADALSTAFFILGVDRARAFCHRHPEIGAVLLAAGDDRPVVLTPSR